MYLTCIDMYWAFTTLEGKPPAWIFCAARVLCWNSMSWIRLEEMDTCKQEAVSELAQLKIFQRAKAVLTATKQMAFNQRNVELVRDSTE